MSKLLNHIYNVQIRYNFKYINWTEEIVDENGNAKFSPMLPCLVNLIK